MPKPNNSDRRQETPDSPTRHSPTPPRKPKGDLQAFFEALQPYWVKPSFDGPYTFVDRYRDFREVFGTEAGKRVLGQIMAEAKGLPITINQVDGHAYLSYRVGKNEIGDWIVRAMDAVPLNPIPDREDER